MKSRSTVSVVLARMLFEYGSELGIDQHELVRLLGIEPLRLEDPEERIPKELYDRLFDEVERRSGDPSFGIRLGERASVIGGGHVLVAMMRSCATVHEALERVFRYHGLASDAYSFALQCENGVARVSVTPREHGTSLPPAQVEQVLAMLASLVRSLTREELRFTRVSFRHRQPANTTEHRRVFGVNAIFSAPCDGLEVDLHNLSLSLPMADFAVLEALESLVAQRLARIESTNSWTARAERQLAEALLRGNVPTIEMVAARLAVSRMALRRSLREEGTTYKKVLDQVRERLAKDYLEQPGLSLYDIAFMLGYSEQSTFNHAFRRWTGRTPTEYRGALQL